MLKPLTNTTPRFPGPEEPVLRKVSVGEVAIFKTKRVRVGVFLLIGAPLDQFVRLARSYLIVKPN